MEKEKIIQIPLTKITHWITTIYMVFLGVVLPLYHREGFCMIGDRKYRLFFACSVIIVPVVLLLILIQKSYLKQFNKLTITDKCVLLYGTFVLISAACSEYRNIAIWGFEDWHMGAISQLLFVGIYFMVSRGWIYSRRYLQALAITSAFIFLIAIGNRYAIDPLSMFSGLEYWNKTHLLSTIGNINWYCGYACTVFPLGLYYFWIQPRKENSKWKIMIAALYVMSVGATLITQGSESGIVTLIVILFIIGFFSIGFPEKKYRYIQMHILIGLTIVVLGSIYRICDKTQIYFAEDLKIDKILLNPIWIIYTAVALSSWLKYRKNIELYETTYKKIDKKKYIGIIAISIVIGIVIIVSHAYNNDFFSLLNQASIFNLNDEWASGRGLLWKITGKAYWQLPFIKKIIGVGSDCFAPYIYSQYANQLNGFLAEWWGDAYVANAHNEWLNMLLNNGVFGFISYCGIYMTACWRNSKNSKTFAIAWCIIAYCVNSSVSFQQVTSTPFIFALMGIGENILNKKQKETSEDGKI